MFKNYYKDPRILASIDEYLTAQNLLFRTEQSDVDDSIGPFQMRCSYLINDINMNEHNYENYKDYMTKEQFDKIVRLVKLDKSMYLDDIFDVFNYSDSDFDKFIKLCEEHKDGGLCIVIMNDTPEDIIRIKKICSDLNYSDVKLARKYMDLTPEEYDISINMVKHDSKLRKVAFKCAKMTDDKRTIVMKASSKYDFDPIVSFITSFLKPEELERLDILYEIIDYRNETLIIDIECIIASMLDKEEFEDFIKSIVLDNSFELSMLISIIGIDNYKILKNISKLDDLLMVKTLSIDNFKNMNRARKLGIDDEELLFICSFMDNEDFSQFLIAFRYGIDINEAILYGFVKNEKFYQAFDKKGVSSNNNLVCCFLDKKVIEEVNEIDEDYLKC